MTGLTALGFLFLVASVVGTILTFVTAISSSASARLRRLAHGLILLGFGAPVWGLAAAAWDLQDGLTHDASERAYHLGAGISAAMNCTAYAVLLLAAWGVAVLGGRGVRKLRGPGKETKHEHGRF